MDHKAINVGTLVVRPLKKTFFYVCLPQAATKSQS